MSIRDAEKAFKAAAKGLGKLDDRPLWNMNAGFLHLCDALKELQAQMADIDRKIVYISKQIAAQ